MVFDESIMEYRNVVDMDNRKYRVDENGSLFMSNVDYFDEKKYYCMSNSPGLTRNASASLSVYGKTNYVL